MKIVINNKSFKINKANTFFKRLTGLMFKKNIKEGLFIPKCNNIHTFFMKDNIDVIMLDKNKKIVLIKKNLEKNKIIYKKEAYHTIELPKNSIENLNLNETLTIID